MAAKFFTGLPLDGPDPECVQGYGEELLKNRKQKDGGPVLPTSSIVDHSHRTERKVREILGRVHDEQEHEHEHKTLRELAEASPVSQTRTYKALFGAGKR